MLSGRPNLDELCEHVSIGYQWYKFGVLLKLDPRTLDSIERMSIIGDDIKALKMFDLWLSTNPKAMRKEIIDTLKKQVIDRNAVAEQYLMALKESKLEK